MGFHWNHGELEAAEVCLCLRSGGLPLRSLVDHLMRHIQELSAQPPELSLHVSWQCDAAAGVTLLSEVVFGASQAWQPASWLGGNSRSEDEEAAARELSDVVSRLQEDFVAESLWGVQTHKIGSRSGDEAKPLTPQVQTSPFGVARTRPSCSPLICFYESFPALTLPLTLKSMSSNICCSLCHVSVPQL